MTKRRRLNKDSQVTINGKVVDAKTIRREISRHAKSQTARLLETSKQSSELSDIFCDDLTHARGELTTGQRYCFDAAGYRRGGSIPDPHLSNLAVDAVR